MKKDFLTFLAAAFLIFFLAAPSLAVPMSSESYGIDGGSMTGGSGEGSSESFEALGTTGQSSPVGDIQSESYTADTGVFDDSDLDGDGVLVDLDDCPLENSTGYDANRDGCIDTISGLITVVNTLPDDVLSDKTKNSLASKVANALNSSDLDKDDIAIKQLNAFINEVNAQKGKKVSVIAADMLIEYATNVIGLIQTG